MALGLVQDFSMHSGDNRDLQVTIKDAAGAVVNITGAALTWALSKGNGSDGPRGTALVTKTVGSGITIVDGANGRADIVLVPADTEALAGDYYHELQLVAGGSSSTVLYGTVTILKNLVE